MCIRDRAHLNGQYLRHGGDLVCCFPLDGLGVWIGLGVAQLKVFHPFGQGLVGAVVQVQVFAAQLFVGVELLVVAHGWLSAARVALAVDGV